MVTITLGIQVMPLYNFCALQAKTRQSRLYPHPKGHGGHPWVGLCFKIGSYLRLAVRSLHPAQPEFPADVYGSIGSSVSWLYVRRTKAE